ncbi:winged helix-turn-helix transcriptional regulator [Pedobacter sp. 22163]|uniref:winged helix-turn-helix transcriptional regulator n=1 Tax=Pedobacter sp. 22163 TaxID=3453883 RepID=UPI003F8262F0
MRKETSTNALNEQIINDSCGMANLLSVMGGRWKPAILCRLIHGTMRYNELKKTIEGISERMLVSQLRELERDGIITRTVHPEVPPKVEYKMTDIGLSMRDVLDAMSKWGNTYRMGAGQKPCKNGVTA